MHVPSGSEAGTTATPGNGTSFEPAIGADGRFVAFSSVASVAGDTTKSGDVFVRDRTNGTTTLVSVAR